AWPSRGRGRSGSGASAARRRPAGRARRRRRCCPRGQVEARDRKSTRLNSSHVKISYAVFCLKKKKTEAKQQDRIQLGKVVKHGRRWLKRGTGAEAGERRRR